MGMLSSLGGACLQRIELHKIPHARHDMDNNQLCKNRTEVDGDIRLSNEEKTTYGNADSPRMKTGFRRTHLGIDTNISRAAITFSI